MRDDRPLLAGVPRPTRRRRERYRPRATLTLAALGLAAIGFAALADPAPRLVWNASASAPVGLYWISHTTPSRGDFVLADLPPGARHLAAARGYLPEDVPLVKRVAALSSDAVCSIDDAISVNGRLVAERLARDRLGRPLPRWTGCRVLADDELLLLMEGVPASFDGRYFGPVHRTAVIGRLVPLWTE